VSPEGNERAPEVLVYVPLRGEALHPDSIEVQGCGGCLVLTMLADELRRRGVRAETLPFDAEPTPALRRSIASGDTVVVYPEAVRDNALDARRVVRWVLYHVRPRWLRAWRESGDLVFAYWPHFLPPGETAPSLRLADAGLHVLKDRGLSRRGIGVRVGKGSRAPIQPAALGREQVLEALNGLPRTPEVDALKATLTANPWRIEEVPDQLNRSDMVARFNRLALLVSGDTDSAVSCLAALCGCASVVLPPPGFDPASRAPCFYNGVAFGWHELPHALTTVDRLRDDLHRIEEEGRATVTRLLDEVDLRFATSLASRTVVP
jgi:hypothetical protein